MVRRAAAQHLGKFAETMEPDFIAQELVPTFQSLSADGAPVGPFPSLGDTARLHQARVGAFKSSFDVFGHDS